MGAAATLKVLPMSRSLPTHHPSGRVGAGWQGPLRWGGREGVYSQHLAERSAGGREGGGTYSATHPEQGAIGSGGWDRQNLAVFPWGQRGE